MSNGITVGHRSAAMGSSGGQVFVVDKSAHDRRVSELLAANTVLVEKRRAATALLREMLPLVMWDAPVAAQGLPRPAPDLRVRIEKFLSEIHA